ncbi:MAG: hypothetical protein QW087_06125 [Methanomassiliicoccales archaeon]
MVSVVEAAGELIIGKIKETRERILSGEDVEEEFNRLLDSVNKIVEDLDKEFRWILNLFW